jgi:hypothetical protein
LYISIYRQLKLDRRAPAQFAVNPYLSAMRLNDFTGDQHTEAGTFFSVRFLRTDIPKGLEKLFNLLRGYSRT